MNMLCLLLIWLIAAPVFSQTWRGMDERYAVVGIVGGGDENSIAVIHDKQAGKNLVVRAGQSLDKGGKITVITIAKKFVVVGNRKQQARLLYDSFATHQGQFSSGRRAVPFNPDRVPSRHYQGTAQQHMPEVDPRRVFTEDDKSDHPFPTRRPRVNVPPDFRGDLRINHRGVGRK